MKLIPDEVSVVGFALLGLSVSIEMGDSHGVGVQSPQRNVFLFQGVVCGLFALVSSHTVHLTLWALSFQGRAVRRP